MNLLKAAASVSGMTLLSRITGFVRDTLLAVLFGAGAAMDAFVVAFRIPNLLRRLFAEGAFSQAFVPVLGEYRTRNGDELSMVQCTEVADGSVRMAAGEALTDDAIDCKLVRPDRRAYRVAFTAEQWTRLSQVFAQGVCDYTVAGKDQQPAQPWQAYLGSVGQL